MTSRCTVYLSKQREAMNGEWCGAHSHSRPVVCGTDGPTSRFSGPADYRSNQIIAPPDRPHSYYRGSWGRVGSHRGHIIDRRMFLAPTPHGARRVAGGPALAGACRCWSRCTRSIFSVSAAPRAALHIFQIPHPGRLRVRGPLACYSLRESGDYITLHYPGRLAASSSRSRM